MTRLYQDIGEGVAVEGSRGVLRMAEMLGPALGPAGRLVFLVGFFLMKLGVYRNLPWVYVKLMNLSQPYKKSILLYKSKSL